MTHVKHNQSHDCLPGAEGGTVNETACAKVFGFLIRLLANHPLYIVRLCTMIKAKCCTLFWSYNCLFECPYMVKFILFFSCSFHHIVISVLPSLNLSYYFNPSFLLCNNLSVIEYADFTWLTPITPAGSLYSDIIILMHYGSQDDLPELSMLDRQRQYYREWDVPCHICHTDLIILKSCWNTMSLWHWEPLEITCYLQFTVLSGDNLSAWNLPCPTHSKGAEVVNVMRKRQEALIRIELGKHTWTWPLLAVEKFCCLHILMVKGNDRLNWTEKDIYSRLFWQTLLLRLWEMLRRRSQLWICEAAGHASITVSYRCIVGR